MRACGRTTFESGHRLVRDYVDTEGGDIQLEFLPPYSPELNPVEYLWALVCLSTINSSLSLLRLVRCL